MRLHRHDELVGAMAKARCRADGFAWGAISSTLQRDYLKNAAAALDALLEAAVKLDVAEITQSEEGGRADCIALRMEASDDNA